uniref:Uncharacterized protein LOC105047775 isoform X1 n=1 Tax=Elaeis guineensis var. tenera TaxID=51953 RepID=A0A6I9REB2_ELAGV|nr:uncharacterized protein LOC105047775 isoform X1 [Elaeis guineensis]
MWRRASSHLQTLATPWRRSAPHLLRRSAQNTLQSRAFASIISSPFRKTSPLLSSESGNVPTKKRVEDVMPIATGYERAELEAELEGRKRFTDMDTPVGPFGTKVWSSYSILCRRSFLQTSSNWFRNFITILVPPAFIVTFPLSVVLMTAMAHFLSMLPVQSCGVAYEEHGVKVKRNSYSFIIWPPFHIQPTFNMNPLYIYF